VGAGNTSGSFAASAMMGAQGHSNLPLPGSWESRARARVPPRRDRRHAASCNPTGWRGPGEPDGPELGAGPVAGHGPGERLNEMSPASISTGRRAILADLRTGRSLGLGRPGHRDVPMAPVAEHRQRQVPRRWPVGGADGGPIATRVGYCRTAAISGRMSISGCSRTSTRRGPLHDRPLVR